MISRHVFRPVAERDIDDVVVYLADQSIEAAMRFYDQLHLSVERLKHWPGMGRTCEIATARLMGVRIHAVDGFPNHLIYYAVRDDVLLVLRVLHAARDRDQLLSLDDFA